MAVRGNGQSTPPSPCPRHKNPGLSAGACSCIRSRGAQAMARERRRRNIAPIPPKPMIIIAQVAGSGITPRFPLVAKPVERNCVQPASQAPMCAPTVLPLALGVSTRASEAHVPLVFVSMNEIEDARSPKPSVRSVVWLKDPNPSTLLAPPLLRVPALFSVTEPNVHEAAFTFTSTAWALAKKYVGVA